MRGWFVCAPGPCYARCMAGSTLIRQLLDPVTSPPPDAWLWPCIFAGALVTLGGVMLIARMLRAFGSPVGSLPPQIGLMAIGLGLGVMVLPPLIVDPMQNPMLGGAVTLLVSVAAFVLLAITQSAGPEAPQWLRVKPRDLARAFALWLVLLPTLVACVLASVAGVRLAGYEVAPQPQIEELTRGSGPLWVAGWFALAGVAVPLAEELIFRLALFGALAGWLARGKGWRDPGRLAALAASIALFVAAHGDWVIGIVPLCVLAWALTGLFAHSCSLWPCVLVHGLHNSLVVALQFWLR